MKKFLIAVICIIPVIVVLALSATSDIILRFAPVNPESIVIRDSSNNIIEDGTLIMASTDSEDYLIIEIYPTITPDKNIVTDEVKGATASVELVRQGESNRYTIVASGAGAVSLIVRAEKNINVQKQLNFYVESTEINKLNIYDEKGNSVETTTNRDDYVSLEPYKLTVPTKFYFDAFPIDALSDDIASWSVVELNDEERLVAVENGVVRPLKRASGGGNSVAVIKLEVWDKGAAFHERYFAVDVSEAVTSSGSVYVEDEKDLSDAIEEVILVGSGSIGNLNFSYEPAEADGVYVVTGSYEDEEGGTVEFEFNLNVNIGGAKWKFTDGYSTVYTNNGNYIAGFGYIGGSAFSEEELSLVRLTSSDPGILEVTFSQRMWRMRPKKAGTITLTAEFGGESVSKSLTVRERPLVIFQDLVAADEELGIRMDRTWGTEWVTADEEGNKTLTSDFRMGIKGDIDTFDVIWTAVITDYFGERFDESTEGFTVLGGTEQTEEQLAPITEEEYLKLIPAGDGTQAVIMRLNPEKMYGATLTLTARAYVENRPIDSVSASFTFKFHDIPSVNVYDWYEMRYVVERYDRDIFMQAAITVPDEVYASLQRDVDAIDMKSSICGNGFLFQMTGVAPHDKVSIFGIEGSFYHFYKGKELPDGTAYDRGIIFEDMRISGYPTMEGLVEVSEKQGKASYFFCRSWAREKLTYRYCQIYNCTKGVHGHGSDLFTLEGCIIGDNYSTGGELAFSKANHESGCKVVLKNNVFKTSKGPSLMVTPRNLGGDMGTSITPYIEVQGFMDVYNWKTRKELPDVFSTMISTMLAAYLGGLTSVVSDAVADIMTTVVSQSEYENFFFRYGGEEYCSLAVSILGIMNTVSPERMSLSPESKMMAVELPMHDENGKPLGNLSGAEEIIDMISAVVPEVEGMRVDNNPLIISADYKTGAPAIMPGEQIPNDRALYDRLTGKA